MMKSLMDKTAAALMRADGFLTKRRMVFLALFAFLQAALLAAYNVSSGPLHNLFDIGGWDNRALFIALSAAVHAALLLLCAALSHTGFARSALRQLIVTAGYYIMLMAINHKTYAFVHVMLPMIRAMDAGGPAAGLGMGYNASAPSVLLTYLLTRGPVYDMYLLKLFGIACMLTLALIAMRMAEKHGFGWRTEALLVFAVILPQGYMNAACSTLPEIGAAALLGAAMLLLFGFKKPCAAASAACFGAAAAISGAALYALPVYLWLIAKKRIRARQLAPALIVPVVSFAACAACGMPAGQTVLSLFAAVLMKPAYACGAPGAMNLLARAEITEMPHYAPVLSHFESLDLITHAQIYYTPEHFEQISAGFVLLCLACCLFIWLAVYRMANRPALHRVFVLALGSLIFAPGVTSAAWLIVDLIALYAIFCAPRLRLPACMTLFATAAAAVYPLAEEVMVPMAYCFVLCLLALCLLLDVIPMPGEKEMADRD